MQVIPASDTEFTLSELETAVAELDQLETLPSVAERVLSITADPDCDLADVVDAIAPDPGLTARLMKVANSAYFPRPVDNLRGAIVRLGLRDVRALTVTAALVGGPTSPFIHALWDRSLRCAALAASLARAGRIAVREPFLCGLLHDFGSLVLARLRADAYTDVVGEPDSDEQVERERAAFGYDHCDVGALVAAKWNLPPDLPYVMQFHHAPADIDALELPSPIVDAVRLVALARSIGRADFDFGAADRDLADGFGLDAEALAGATEAAWDVYAAYTRELLGDTASARPKPR
ncbi:MAG: HDOD domain-containing protein [Deltaproteobacteria bacterium]|nr:MAG: HDOD domain-containing protein [Deltaproteobacteria bacterium]